MSELSELIKEIGREILQEQATVYQQDPNMQGSVIQVNDDGTVNVQVSNGSVYTCGTPVVRTLGDLVIVVTADGKKVAV
jgi:hypothetical protein